MTEGKRKKTTVIRTVSAAMLAVMIFAVFILAGCANMDRHPASYYTEEEHLANVAQRVRERYIDGGFFEDFQIYPLYDENEKLSYFLVDFKPQGYIYIRINYDEPVFGVWTADIYSVDTWSIFCIGNSESKPTWRRYNIGEPNDSSFTESNNRHFETDENGDFIEYSDSHFRVADIGDEKKYLLQVRQNNQKCFIPAIKTGERYLNLVSMEEIDYKKEPSKEEYAVMDNMGFLRKPEFDL